jgi:hypothetical protein
MKEKRCDFFIDGKMYEHWVQDEGYRALIKSISHFRAIPLGEKTYYKPIFTNGIEAKFALTPDEYKTLEKEWLVTI